MSLGDKVMTVKQSTNKLGLSWGMTTKLAFVGETLVTRNWRKPYQSENKGVGE